MSKIRGFLWIILAGYFASWNIVHTSGIREDITVVRICNVSDPVDLDVFNDYMMHHDFQHLKNHARELSMNRHGSFRVNKIKLWMHKSNLGHIDQEILLHKCIRMAELSDPCTRARQFTECFWMNHQGTESLDNDNHTLRAIIGKKDVM